MTSVLGMSVIGMAGTALGKRHQAYRTQPKNAVGLLSNVAAPQINALMTMEADFFGFDTHRALRRAQSIDNDERWAPDPWVGAQASVETDCRLALSFWMAESGSAGIEVNRF